MANNNNQLFDAAYVGFIAGGLNGRPLISAVGGTYTPIATAAAVFAAKVDSLIPADGAIVTPVTSATLAKVNLLSEIVAAALSGSYTISTNPNDYTPIATAIVAAYNASTGGLALP